MTNQPRPQVAEARDAILAHKFFQPQVAIVLGSGLGKLAEQVVHATSIPFHSIPFFPKPRAAGHAGQLILGYLGGTPVAVLQGRCHRYEGFTNADARFPVYCMQALGAGTVITTNAAGGLNSRFRVGDLMVIDSHIDQLWPRAFAQPEDGEVMPSENNAVALRRLGSPYDLTLIERVQSLARRQDTVLHAGCYLATLGPTYETRSEYQMFRWMGADAVGMSTLPEVLAAKEVHMSVVAFSVITNVASTDLPQSTTHDEVLHAGNQAGPKLMRIIQQLLENMSGQPD